MRRVGGNVESSGRGSKDLYRWGGGIRHSLKGGRGGLGFKGQKQGLAPRGLSLGKAIIGEERSFKLSSREKEKRTGG